jgi:hypothetical protein
MVSSILLFFFFLLSLLVVRLSTRDMKRRTNGALREGKLMNGHHFCFQKMDGSLASLVQNSKFLEDRGF